MTGRSAVKLLVQLLHSALRLQTEWGRKQKAAAPSRYYGGGGTIHGNLHLDVEVHDGTVVAVWYRCQALPFDAHEVGPWRADEMRSHQHVVPQLTGVEVMDVDT